MAFIGRKGRQKTFIWARQRGAAPVKREFLQCVWGKGKIRAGQGRTGGVRRAEGVLCTGEGDAEVGWATEYEGGQQGIGAQVSEGGKEMAGQGENGCENKDRGKNREG